MTDRAPVETIAVDTGVWIESLLYGGPAEELVKMAVAETVQLLTCESLVVELDAVLQRALDFSPEGAAEVCRFVRDCAEVVDDRSYAAAGADEVRANLLRASVERHATLIATTERSALLTQEAPEGIPIVAVL